MGRQFGAIRKLPSGNFQASYIAPGIGRVTAPITFARRDQADTWLAAQRVDLARETWKAPSVGSERAKCSLGGECVAASSSAPRSRFLRPLAASSIATLPDTLARSLVRMAGISGGTGVGHALRTGNSPCVNGDRECQRPRSAPRMPPPPHTQSGARARSLTSSVRDRISDRDSCPGGSPNRGAVTHSLSGHEAPSDLQHVELGRRRAEPEFLGRIDGVGRSRPLRRQ